MQGEQPNLQEALLTVLQAGLHMVKGPAAGGVGMASSPMGTPPGDIMEVTLNHHAVCHQKLPDVRPACTPPPPPLNHCTFFPHGASDKQ